MNSKIKIKGQLRTYLQWPVFLSVLMIVMNVWIYTIHIQAGIIMSLFVVIYLCISIILFKRNKPAIMHDMIAFAAEYGQIQKQLINELAVPYALLEEDGRILWMNKEFSALTGKERHYQKSITNIFPDITKEALPKTDKVENISVEYEGKNFRVDMRKMSLDDVTNDSSLMEVVQGSVSMIALYFFDETEICYYMKENREQKLVAGLLYLDNYEEALDNLEEVKRSLLVALIDRKITKYITNIDGLIRKFEKDKYFVIIRQKYLSYLQTNKFSLLDEVKNVNIGNEMAVTVSIGLGVNADTYVQGYEYARTAIDLALGRGGDQAVIKDREKIYYYGGKSQQVEKSTRVKARVKAHALKEVLEGKDKVAIMGHKIGDVDSFGAAIGIYRAAKTCLLYTSPIL